MDVPEDKIDVVTELSTKVEGLNSKLNEAVNSNLDLKDQLTGLTREVIVREVSKGLADTDAAKLKGLAEEISFTSVEDYTSKLKDIKERTFKPNDRKQKLVENLTQNPITADGLITEENTEKKVPVEMRPYVAALDRTNKK